MLERFTDRARKTMALANQEARRFNHEFIGTEHILLGLVEEGLGVGPKVLKNLGVDLRKVRSEVERLLKRGPDVVGAGKLPQTPRAKKVIEFAIGESRNMGHDYVGTEHLLMGLLRVHDAVPAQVLTNLGVDLDRVRKEVLSVLAAAAESANAAKPVNGVAPVDGTGVAANPTPAVDPELLNDLVSLATSEASRLGVPRVSAEYFLLAALQERSGRLRQTVQSLGIDPHALLAGLRKAAENLRSA